MKALKTCLVFLLGGLLLGLVYFGIGLLLTLLTITNANADEVPPEQLKVKDEVCNYVQQAGDTAQPVCRYEEHGVLHTLEGEGYLQFRICGKPYTMDIKCPKVEK